jgi:hypothetical protein
MLLDGVRDRSAAARRWPRHRGGDDDWSTAEGLQSAAAAVVVDEATVWNGPVSTSALEDPPARPCT